MGPMDVPVPGNGDVPAGMRGETVPTTVQPPSPAPEPRDLAVAFLVFAGLELAGLPAMTAISRRFEREADRWSLELTDDLEAFERAHVGLARSNLSDLAPPRWAYVLLFTHPTPRERLAFGRARAGAA